MISHTFLFSLLAAAATLGSAAPVESALGKRATTTTKPATTTTRVATTTTKTTTTRSPTPSPTAAGVHTGHATWFTQDNNAGACGNYNLDATPLVALDYRLYGNMDMESQYCGRYVNITNTDNGKRVIAIVADACPSCDGPYALDLSLGAFDLIGDRDTGVLPISWTFLPTTYKPRYVTPTLTGPTSTVRPTTVRPTTTTTRAATTTSRAATTTTPRTTTVAVRSTTTSSVIVRTVSTTSRVSSPTPTSTWVSARFRQNNITAFGATHSSNNTNAIISWFHTNSTVDSTNGNSWCGFPYNDNTPGFAVSLKQMLDNFRGDYETAARAFCGLEATVLDRSSGFKMNLVITDAFDDRWVRTPNSIDMVYGPFTRFNGGPVRDKNIVKYGSWQFTGRRDLRYQFKGVGAGRTS